jgi:guanylate kinase
MRQGILLIVSGPAGSGKGTVVNELISAHPELKLSISATTRAPRPGDKHGETYYFISKDEFKERIEKGEMLEYNHFTGNDNYYGTPKKEVDEALAGGTDVILEIDVNGAMQVKEKMPNAVTVMLTPPDGKTLESRLVGRGTESAEEIQKRLATAKNEVSLLPKYDYSVVNEDGKIKKCAEEIYSIIKAEHLRTIYTKSIIEKFI